MHIDSVKGLVDTEHSKSLIEKVANTFYRGQIKAAVFSIYSNGMPGIIIDNLMLRQDLNRETLKLIAGHLLGTFIPSFYQGYQPKVLSLENEFNRTTLSSLAYPVERQTSSSPFANQVDMVVTRNKLCATEAITYFADATLEIPGSNLSSLVFGVVSNDLRDPEFLRSIATSICLGDLNKHTAGIINALAELQESL